MDHEAQRARLILKVLIISVTAYFLLGTAVYFLESDSIVRRERDEPGSRYEFTTLGYIFAPVLVFWAFASAQPPE